MRAVLVFVLAGCSLYFGQPVSHRTPDSGIDSGPPDGGRYCYSNIFGVIASPADGATGVPIPTRIQSHLDPYAGGVDYAKYQYLFDAEHHPLSPQHDFSCSGYDGYWSYMCFDLQPDTVYQFEVGYFCYSDDQHLYPVAHTTFRTAP